MSLQNFQTKVIAANFIEALRKIHVFASVANQNYTGNLKNYGDKVSVIQVSNVTVAAYTRDTAVTATLLDDAATELVADQGEVFGFSTEDVDAVMQKQAVLTSTAERAAYQIRDVVDQYFAALYAQAGLTSYSTGTTPWNVTSLNVQDVLLDVKEKMARVPLNGRFIICPEWFHNKLILAGLDTKQDNNAIFTNGMVDRIEGFDILLSENVSASTGAPTWDQTRIIAGVRGESFSFADVISKIESYRVQGKFQDAVQGLYIWAGKIMRPDMTCCIYADKTAEA